MGDPRIFFAAERTLLAWIRTGLTVMGFGFVVARFGLFLQVLEAQRVSAHPVVTPLHTASSTLVGIVLVLLGALTLFVAAFEHRRFTSTVPREDLPASHGVAFPVAIAGLLGCVGLFLAVYLAL